MVYEEVEMKDEHKEKFREGKIRYWVSRERKVWHQAVDECHGLGGEVM